MNSSPLSLALQRLAVGESLSPAECQNAVGSILDGAEPEAATGAFLAALHVKGESADELHGAVSAIRERMIAFEVDSRAGACLDTCGTGGDGADTVNVSTATAIVVAACGERVVKHGNRAATGKSGSSDVLDQLGVAIDLDLPTLRRCLEELGIAFLFARGFTPDCEASPRCGGSFRSGRSSTWSARFATRPAPRISSLGSPGEGQGRRLAEALARARSIHRALVVTGCDGLDEVTLDGPTQVRVVESGTIREATWTPADFGLPRVPAPDLVVTGPEESAQRLTRTFAGEPGPVRDIVLANAAAALWTIAPCPLPQAVARAARAIDSGAAARLVQRWSELTRGRP